MRINQISVKKLFGVFDHTIPLNVSDRITIIHGPNGFGKTILLKMIYGLFNSRYSEIRNIPFTEFRIDFDDGRSLKVTKAIEPESDDYNDPTIQLFDTFKCEITDTFLPKLKARRTRMLGIIDEIIPGLDRISSTKWFYEPTNEELSLEEIIDRFNLNNLLPNDFIQGNKEPDWLLDFKKNIKNRVIESQRLLNYGREQIKTSSTSFSIRSPSMMPVPTVTTYAEELAEEIQEKLTEYATLSQSLDRTFPGRVVKEKPNPNLTEENLRGKLSQIEKKRDRLRKVGVLEVDENPYIQVEENQKIDEKTKTILSLYVEDVDKKLNLFEKIANKIEIFQSIIQDRFKYKKMTINQEEGFRFTTVDGSPLYPTNLSSGEQHQLVLLYELLFKVEPNSLILIDEPELSLHLAWQIKFLEDLQEITQLGNFDVLIATHSPDIISDRWDLTVELKGPVA